MKNTLNKDNSLNRLYESYLEYTDHMVGEYGAMEVAAIMMTQALSIYRSALDEDSYDRMVDAISSNRHSVKTFNRPELQ
jgi:hypothetical protein